MTTQGNTKCTSCSTPFISADGLTCGYCENFIPNCIQCNPNISTPVCIQCRTQYIPSVNSLSQSYCAQCSDIIFGCSVCNNSLTSTIPTCSYCQFGYFLTFDGYKCKKCYEVIQNCS